MIRGVSAERAAKPHLPYCVPKIRKGQWIESATGIGNGLMDYWHCGPGRLPVLPYIAVAARRRKPRMQLHNHDEQRIQHIIAGLGT